MTSALASRVVLGMVLALAGAERNVVHPCKPGEYLDRSLKMCTDCAVACHVPNSPDCVEFCFGGKTNPPVLDPPAEGWNLPQLLTATLIPTAMIIVFVMAGILYKVRQQTQHPDPENGEQDRLREGQNGDGDDLHENEDGNLEENEDGEVRRPVEELGEAFTEEANVGDSLRQMHGQEDMDD